MRIEGRPDDSALSGRYNNPQVLLSISLLLSVTLLGLLGWQAVSARRALNEVGNQHLSIERLAGDIVYLDETLTSSARLAVATGDQRWIERYEEHLPQLDAAIELAGELSDDGFFNSSDVAELRSANNVMVRARAEALQLAERGSLASANLRLDGPVHLERKERYTASIEALVDEMRAQSETRVASARQQSETGVILAFVALGATVVIAARLSHHLRRWKLALDEAERQREARIVERAADAAREAQAAQSAEHERLLNRLVENAPISIFALDEVGRFTMAKGGMIDGHPSSDRGLLGQSIADVYGHFPAIVDAVGRALVGENVVDDLELPDGSVFQAAYIPVLAETANPDSPSTGVVGIYTNVTDRAALERELHHQAEHDGLTGLMNRSGFRRELAATLRTDAAKASVLLVDLDGFKEVNDTHGHEVGDVVLKTVADRMRSCMRDDEILTRLGGDEFAVIVRSTRGSEAQIVDQIADRLLAAASLPIAHKSGLINIGASIGLVGPGLGDYSGEQVLRQADLAMYEAKRQGKNQLLRFEQSMSDRFTSRLRLSEELGRACENDELRVHYQPVWSAAANQTVGVEALVRWQHPRRGLLFPADFVPFAESTAMISEIDRWVLRAACRQVA